MTDARRIAQNRAAHDRLRGGYDARHPEIHNDIEQARLTASVAQAIDCPVSSSAMPYSLTCRPRLTAAVRSASLWRCISRSRATGCRSSG